MFKVKKFKKTEKLRKPTKTISGVTPIAVVLKPQKCKHGTCLYCPSLKVPQSYTPKSPAIMRAAMLNYNSYEQTKARLNSFKVMNHPTDKIEIIVMGGTFPDYPESYKKEFIKGIYDGLNGKIAKDLDKAKKINETAKHRCVALCLETRPDKCSDKDIKQFLDFGCTRVEIGVQAIDDKIYQRVKRGHKVKDVVDATKRLKKAGFKVGYHLMPGLPGSNIKKDIKMFKEIFSNQNFKPDQVKIYPCQVIKGAKLENLYWNKKYKPYNKKQTQKLLIELMKIIPRYCRAMRIMRELPPDYIVAGVIKIDLRKDVEQELRKLEKKSKKFKIKEIRFREIGFFLRDNSVEDLERNLKLKITKYKASEGDEYFLEIINKDDILFGLLRLRIDNLDSIIPLTTPNIRINNTTQKFNNKYTDNGTKLFMGNRDKLTQANRNERVKFRRAKRAVVRELHVYGHALKLKEKSKNKLGQHTGLGKQLMNKAEEIVKKNKIKKLQVISGVGVREYYKKLGYKLGKNKIYMERNLAQG